MNRFSQSNIELKNRILEQLRPQFQSIDAIALQNTAKILDAFRAHKVSDYDFRQTTGYGYGDNGRDKLDAVWADIFGAPAALVRNQFASGTHALATALFGVLRPGDELLSLTGTPYDTLRTVIGVPDPAPGCLTEFGIRYRETPFEQATQPETIASVIAPETRLVLIQRSCGYSLRHSLSVSEIAGICSAIKAAKPDCIVMVDNCYGEFTETLEPTDVEVDLIAGSLIKNPGGGIAPTGGYIAGRADLVELAASRLTAPGIGAEVGSSIDGYRLFYQGLFLAPHTTAQAMKSALFAAAFFGALGYSVHPKFDEVRHDIIQGIELRSPEKLIAFCRGLQKYSPVDSHLKPEPAPMPGYADPVVMAGGTFVQGSSIELSADGPLREPYAVYLQGGLTFEHALLALLGAADEMHREKGSH
ncbi:MAG: aminotransferase class I/II-fold pyridoxal phosphate-dependent enzyme [Negativicutes bacterium]